MIIILKHGLKFIKADLVIMVVIILSKLSRAYFRSIVFINDIEMLQVAENGRVELLEASLVHLSP